MYVKKKKNQFELKNYFLVLLSLSTLFVLLINVLFQVHFRNHSLLNRQNDSATIKNPNPTSAEKNNKPQVDTLNDGVYTNNEYEISFEYPNEVFTNQLDLFHPKNIGLIQQEWYAEQLRDELFLTIAIRYKIHKERYDYLQHSISSKLALGEEYKHTDGSIRRIGTHFLNGSEGIISMTEVERLNGTTIFSYLITCEQDSVLYSLSISSNDMEKLEQYYGTFHEIVDSLEIADSGKNSYLQ